MSAPAMVISPRRRRVRHHVNPLKKGFQGILAEPLVLPAEPVEVEVELGCADARWLFERAQREPAVSLLGLEIRREWVERVNEQAQRQGLGQRLRAVHANINTDLPHLFPRARLSRVYVNFPDPWFKRAQQKRRLMTPELAAALTQALRPGGELFFQSDVFELALDAMAVLEQTPGLRNARGEWSFLGRNPYGVESLREVRVQERGLPVWRILYLATDNPAGRCSPAG